MLERRKIIGVCALALLLAACGEPAIVSTPEAQADPTETESPALEPAPEAQVFGVGDTVLLGDFEITLNGARITTGDEFREPDEGHVFLYVDVTFRNQSDDPLLTSSLFSTEVRDSEGWSYDVDIGATAGNDKPSPADSEISPGGSRRGEIGYQVPAEATGQTWTYIQVFGSEKATFELGAIPGP